MGRPFVFYVGSVVLSQTALTFTAGGNTPSSATSATGAFALENDSKDAAVLVNLDPGAYTVHVTGADGGTGVSLIEVYETP